MLAAWETLIGLGLCRHATCARRSRSSSCRCRTCCRSCSSRARPSSPSRTPPLEGSTSSRTWSGGCRDRRGATVRGGQLSATPAGSVIVTPDPLSSYTARLELPDRARRTRRRDRALSRARMIVAGSPWPRSSRSPLRAPTFAAIGAAAVVFVVLVVGHERLARRLARARRRVASPRRRSRARTATGSDGATRAPRSRIRRILRGRPGPLGRGSLFERRSTARTHAGQNASRPGSRDRPRRAGCAPGRRRRRSSVRASTARGPGGAGSGSEGRRRLRSLARWRPLRRVACRAACAPEHSPPPARPRCARRLGRPG